MEAVLYRTFCCGSIQYRRDHGVTYVFKGPSRIDLWPHFALVVKLEERLHNPPDIVMAPLFEQQLSEAEPTDCLILVEQFHRVDFVHLPPLERAEQ